MPGLFYKPKSSSKEPEPITRFKNLVTEQYSNSNLIKELNETFTLIGEEFKSIKNCELYKFFIGLNEEDQTKIINFLKDIISNKN